MAKKKSGTESQIITSNQNIDIDLINIKTGEKVTFGSLEELYNLIPAMLKKALGYRVEEIVEEYACDDESRELKLNKKKVTKKQVPADLTAIKALLEFLREREGQEQNLSDEELQKEKMRLISELQKSEKS